MLEKASSDAGVADVAVEIGFAAGAVEGVEGVVALCF